MAKTYAEVLNRAWDDIPQPKNLPDGSWLLRLKNVGFFAGDKEKETYDRVTFFVEPREAMDDVRPEDITALGEDYDLSNSDFPVQVTIFRDRDWQKVLKILGFFNVKPEKGESQIDTFKRATGAEAIGYVTTRRYQNKQGIEEEVNDVTGWASVS